MMQFPQLLEAGARVAAISGQAEGDCGWATPDPARRAAFLARAGAPPNRLVALRQCHGDRVVVAAGDEAGCGLGERENALGDADGVVTGEDDLPLGIHVADCVPLYLACPKAVALIHAGREGTSRNIAAKAVAALARECGADAESLTALIGPSAGPCCYQVSGELRDAWVARGLIAEGDHLDLWRTNVAQLIDGGVRKSRIHVIGHCTICMPGLFSYRGNQTNQRNLAVIMR
ncbi:MAG: polyphenol oxidase family protein [Candidatus Hydrogenedentes bacterium]|nr:polyphenol oxidase family protein [Candidatus Hydrogenedentota bacterium]